ncbi:lysylphosphatidylglycerol synthase transmembrane domain-containing protein [Vagococcus teuberi]|uniref:Phosphatidylglycerol lysyltransferase n=1 Tax=Vagococcus teuberi TaxID=519472 RepID=A0A1J0A4M6_9ENTE|nr:lysylphosphatidylglycerol synthase transmembrane domain-containing protein [Vagococcus teuberi]APB30901.1 hypothetical protein BHY08_03080 [Vagococcus teuberi]
MTKKNRWYLILAVILGLIVIGNEMKKVSLEDMAAEFSSINWWWIVVSILCVLVYWGIEAKIVQVLLKRSNPSFSFSTSYRIPLIEHLFNAITPFSTGGQPAQIIAMAKFGVDTGVATSVSLMKFVVYQVWVVINFLICLIGGYSFLSSSLSKLKILILLSFIIHFVIVIGLLMIMYWYSFTRKLVDIIFKGIRLFAKGEKIDALYQKTVEKMDTFYEESRYMREQPVLMFKVSVLTILQLVSYYIIPYFILYGLGIKEMSIFHVVVLHAFITMLISLFPVPGGTGGAEYSFSLLFGTFTLSQSKLVLAIFLWRGVTYYLGIILGLVALTFHQNGQPKVKKRANLDASE